MRHTGSGCYEAWLRIGSWSTFCVTKCTKLAARYARICAPVCFVVSVY